MNRGRHWPWAIALGLAIVIAVNFAFAWVAGQTAPQIDPTYETPDR